MRTIRTDGLREIRRKGEVGQSPKIFVDVLDGSPLYRMSEFSTALRLKPGKGGGRGEVIQITQNIADVIYVSIGPKIEAKPVDLLRGGE